MKALQLRDRSQLIVTEIGEPGDLSADDVLLENRYCGICGIDLHEYADGPQLITRAPHPLTGAELPQVLGHEFSGRVAAVGRDVDTVVVGDRVAVMPLLWCGRCSACIAGRHECCRTLAAVGYNWAWGGMAEHAIVKAHQASPIPESMTDQQGALVEPTAVACHAVRSAPILVGDSVLITGAGPIGQLVALAAAAAGATSITLSEPSAGRRRRAEALGIGEVVDPTDTDVVQLLSGTHPDGVDVAVECSGDARALAACIASVRPGGAVVQTALPPQPLAVDTRALTLRDVALKGVNCFPVDSWPRVIELIASGRLPAERIVTDEVDLDDVVDGGFARLLDPDDDQIKILVRAA